MLPANGLHARRLPSLDRVPPGTVPRRRQYYEGATTSRPASPLAYGFTRGVHADLLSFVLAAALPRGRRHHAGQGPCSAGAPFPGAPSRGRIRDLPGSLTILPMPLPGSRTPVGPAPLASHEAPVLPPPRGQRRLRTIRAISGLATGLQHPLSTLQEHPCGCPCKTRFRLAGSQPLPRGSRTRWIATEGFQLTYMAFLLLRAYPGATSLRSG